jgi:hypothetical protein
MTTTFFDAAQEVSLFHTGSEMTAGVSASLVYVVEHEYEAVPVAMYKSNSLGNTTRNSDYTLTVEFGYIRKV